EIPTTIGIMSLVLLAARRSLEQERQPVATRLASVLKSPLNAALRSKQLGSNLDAIRTRFRNPACHGSVVFNSESYESFVGLLVFNKRFTHWDTDGELPHELPAEMRARLFHEFPAEVRATWAPNDQDTRLYWIPSGQDWDGGVLHLHLNSRDD